MKSYAGQHLGVLGRDPDVDAGVAHLGDGLDVVEVAVGGEDPPDAGRPGDLEQQLVLVGRVDEHGLARAFVAQDEHVVLERPDDDLVDPDVGGLVVRGPRGRHGSRLLPPCVRTVVAPIGPRPVQTTVLIWKLDRSVK